MMKNYISFLLLFLSVVFFGQTYKTIDTADYKQRKDFIKNYSLNNELLVKSMKAKYSGKTGGELTKIYNELGKDFEKQVKNKDFIFNSVFDAKVKDILVRLRKNNPQIPENLKILIAKDNTPNAYCFADGTFVINMGLFNWLNNDSQLAAVISHELGHKLTEHTLKTFLGLINQNQLDKMVVQDIKSTKENQNQRAFSVLKNRVYKKGSENRKQEMQADSLGYTVFKNSDFTRTEFINTLKRLEDFDTISPRELKVETYKKFFNLPKQEFNEKWMKKKIFRCIITIILRVSSTKIR